MPNNVIEVVVKTIDESTGPIRGIVAGFEDIKSSILAGIGGTIVVESFRRFIDNTIEAESAQARLGLTLKNSIEGAFQSAKQLGDFSKEFGASTIFSAPDIDKAQTVLARFDRVFGDTFVSARSAAIDLAAAIGSDLPSAATALGRALESPTLGIRALAQEGIYFTTQQRELITQLDRTGRSAEAARLIIEAVRNSSHGAAEEMRNTLGGAIDRVGNAFSEAFRANDAGDFTKFLNSIADGINKVNAAAKDSPTHFRITDALNPFSAGGKAIGNLFRDSFTATGDFMTPASARKAASTALAPQGDELDLFTDSATRSAAAARIAANHAADQQAAYDATVKAFREFTPTIDLAGQGDKIQDVTRSLFDSIATDAQKTQNAYYDLKARLLEQMSSRGGLPPKVSTEQFNQSIGEFLDKALPEFETPTQREDAVTRARAGLPAVATTSLATDLHRDIPPISNQQKAVNDFFGSVGDSMKGLIATGDLTGRSIAQSLVKALEEQTIFKAIDNVGKYLADSLGDALKNAGGGSGSGSAIGTILSSIGTAIFGRAGGGDFSGLTLVGENGPEYIAGKGRVYTPRQLGNMGGGGNFNAQTNITIQGGSGSASDQKKLISSLRTEMQQNNKAMFNQWQLLMRNNGFGRLRA